MSHPTRIAVYTGSFDPVTLGHRNVIERAAKLFDKLIVGIGVNVEKKPLFTPEERVDLIRKVVSHIPNVDVHTFDGLAVSFVRQCNSTVMVRGATADRYRR
jgi:pantetheine-phosphate adenylyltransferase